MAGENLIHGREGILSIWDGSAYRPIGCLTSTSLNTSLSVLESNTKCDVGNIVRVPDQFSYELSVDGEYLDTTSVGGDSAKASHDYVLNLQQSKEVVVFQLDTGLEDTIYYGSAIITGLDLSQPADAISTFSINLSGTGSLLTDDPQD